MGQSNLEQDRGHSQTPFKVLIIGAGPVGATLAQILRKNGIAFEIFDRDVTVNARRGGSFVLQDCLQHLLPALPSDMADISTVSTNAATSEPDTMAYINGAQSTWVRSLGYTKRPAPGWVLSAGRANFRNWMCQSLPPSSLHFNKRLERYVEDANEVTAYFYDGTSAHGTILVGADGAHSIVRSQLLDSEASRTEINRHIPISGSVTLQADEFAELRKLATGVVVANSPTCHMQIAQLDIEPDGSAAEFWWMTSFAIDTRSGADPREEAKWVVRDATREQLYRRALESCKHMPEILVDVIRRTGPEGIWATQTKLTEFVPPSELPSSRVTLIGDAAHAAAPFGGRGVNCGLRDAVDLGGLIAETGQMKAQMAAASERSSAPNGLPLSVNGVPGTDMLATEVETWTRDEVVTALKRYEETALPRGREVVKDARDKGECIVGPPPEAGKPAKMPPPPPPGMTLIHPPVVLERASWAATEAALARLGA